MNENKPLADQIEIGDVSFSSEVDEFMHTQGKRAFEAYQYRALSPVTVQEAFELRAKKQLIQEREWAEAMMENLGDWRSSNIEELDVAIEKVLEADELWMREINMQTKVVETVSDMLDTTDTGSVQMIVIKEDVAGIRSDYAYLVIYPPDPASGMRRREVSFPTAQCHVINAEAIMRNKKTKVIPGEEFDVGIIKVPAASDSELARTLTESGRTPLDRLFQRAAHAVDRIKNRRGQHIDPYSSFRDENYAAKYALATHKGLGLVSNERITLPSYRI